MKKKLIYLFFILLTSNLFAQKVFHQASSKGTWQYIYPFKDKSYVLAIQNGIGKKDEPGDFNASIIYFGQAGLKTDKIFWKEQVYLKLINKNLTYSDYNSDGIKDLIIFSETGGRGGNAFYFLFLLDPKNRKIKKVKNFEDIVNPEYNSKHKVIVSYGLSGTNHYSIYKISKDYKAYEIGESFEDTFESDPNELDRRIRKILNKTVH